MTRMHNFDRQKVLFIPRKFREASSNETGFKPFYGSNFCEIFDNHAPLTVLRYTLWTHLIEYRCCILMVRERSLLKEVAVDRRNHCGPSSSPVPSISFPSQPVDAHHEEHERGKLGAKFVLYCLGRYSGASPIVSCIVQRRSHREAGAIGEIDIGFGFDRVV